MRKLINKHGIAAMLCCALAIALINSYSITTATPSSTLVSKAVRSTVIICDKSGRTVGTGFFISEHGKVITADHVVRAALSNSGAVGVRPKGSTTCFKSRVLKQDSYNDIALLKATGVYSPFFFRIVNSESVIRGDKVWVVGHPFGLEWNVTSGVVSRKSMTPRMSRPRYVIWVSAWIEQGNSGSALVNESGDVIGIITEFVNPKFPMATHLNIATPGTELKRFMGEI